MEAQLKSELSQAVQSASDRPEVVANVDRLYAEFAAQVLLRKPICVASGKCCHFEQYGHRLYVSTMELAAFVAAGRKGAIPKSPGWDGTGCPFQIGKLCGVHSFRPFGCRVFFCDPTAKQWQQDQYEQFHGQLRKLHEELEVPYFYLEWRAGLEALSLE